MSDHDSAVPFPSTTHEILFAPGGQRALFEKKLLPAYIPRCRWFAGKARDPRRFTVRDVIPVNAEPEAARLLLVEVEYADKSCDTCVLPLQLVTGPLAEEITAHHPGAVLARFSGGILCDGIHDPTFRTALFDLMAGSGNLAGEKGKLIAQPGPALPKIAATPESRALAVEQSNSSIVYGDAVFLKLYRRLETGMNPDAEILRFLSRRGFAHTPPFGGAIEYHDAEGQACVLALATGLAANNGDAWSFTLRELARWFGAHLAGHVVEAAGIESDLLARAGQLGARTGELHLALAADETDPEFSPQPFTAADGRELADGIASSARQVAALIQAKLETLPDPARNLAQRFLEGEAALQSRIGSLAAPANFAKIRTHGDYHLGQVLETGGDFVIIDFEGEPLRSLATRRERRSPFRDVAGMLRSFDYAAHAAVDAQPQHQTTLAPQAANWSVKAQRTFLEAWRATTNGAVFRTTDVDHERALLEAFLLEKALYEVVYEINNRPSWLAIPLRGVVGLVEGAALS